jgi:hypothetical protein
VSDLRARLDQHILPAFDACKIDRVAVVAIERRFAPLTWFQTNLPSAAADGVQN